MDADWSVEIGEGLPWIDVPWEGWVDLGDREQATERIAALSEAQAYPELAAVLLEIHTSQTAAVSSKCDVFPIAIEDAPEMLLDGTAGDQELRCGLGSYIDLAFAVQECSSNFCWYEALVRRVATELLAPIPMPGTSVEIVLRQGSFFTAPGYGLTLYAMGFGRHPEAARAAWAQVMRLSAHITMVEVASRAAGRPKASH